MIRDLAQPRRLAVPSLGIVRALACVLVAVLFCFAAPASAQVADMPPQLAHVGVSEHLDKKLPLDSTWREYNGADVKTVTLGSLVNGSRPALFLFAYHTCPTLCSMVLKATGRAIHDMPWTVGKDYDLVVVSIDPEDNPDNLKHRRDLMIADYNRPGAESGFHFLLGDKPAIDATLAAAGVQVEYDAAQKQWGHPAVIMLLKPNGELARYLYGLEYSPNDVRVGLLEASNGKSISTAEQIILYCYQFDPNGGRYVLVAWRVMRIGGGICALLILAALTFFWLRERKRTRAELDSANKISVAAREPAHSHP